MPHSAAILPEVVHLICPKCGRKGRYRRDRYLAIAGVDDPPSALLAFAKAMGCPLATDREPLDWERRCKVVYDLEARRAAGFG